ncbi:MAG: Ig-like domain-containing protein [Desulfobacterales bacterium]|nr:Ig-like domain-containing protein [Desulfobacterales bacterium]
MRLKRLLVLLVAICLMAFPIMGCDDDGDCELSINEDTEKSENNGDSGDSGGSGSAVVSSLSLGLAGSINAGESTKVSATVLDQDGDAIQNVNVGFSFTPNNSGATLSAPSDVTDADGRASVTYTAGSSTGIVDTIRVSAGSLAKTAQISVQEENQGPSSPQELLTGGADEIKGAGFFDSVSYIGAFDPNAASTWADGWTIQHGETSAEAESRIWDAGRVDTSPATPVTNVGGLSATDNGDGTVTIPGGTMTEDATLTNDRVWQLEGSVFVGDKENPPASGEEGITLTIEAGTKIVGLTNTPSGVIPRLAISRGHKIVAEGTADAPILMTSDTAVGTGEWGGLAISGLAPLNEPGGTELGEGDTGVYGGNDPEDNSGVLQYVIVAHAGYKFTEEDELNGIAFQAVGSGTTVDHIQVHRNADDGVEFYGGTVNARYIYLTENGDDSLDWTSGWQGKVQFVSIHKNASSGDQGIEADNLKADKNATPRSHPVLANMTIRGYPDNGKGMLLRRGTAANFYNIIVTGFGEGQIDFDDLATFENAGTPSALTGELTMVSSLIYGDKLFEDMEEPEEPWSVQDWYNAQNNINPQDPVLNFDGSLSAASPAGLKTGGTTEIGEEGGSAFFQTVSYIGAFDPNAATTWADGWTIQHGETSAEAESRIWDASRVDTSPATQITSVGGLSATDNGDGTVTIPGGTMTEDATLTNDRVWQLEGSVFVGDKENPPAAGEEGITLSIEAGTKIVGLTNTPSGVIPRLAISRGNKIVAEGTADAPILMTSDTAVGTGEWGGLAISGLAPLNEPGGTELGEGDTGVYGGNDPEDNSGVLQYVIVAHAGYKFTEEDELNGIAFQAVGSGTTVDHIQVHRNADDGVEFYGGTVNARYIYLTENGDDSLDWTSGWQGKVQFVSIHKNASSGDQGIEADNLKADKNATPRSHPVLANMTIRGYPDNGKGMLLRRGTAANFYNIIVTGFGEGQIDFDDLATFENAGTPSALTGELTMVSSLIYGDKLFEDMEEPEEPWSVQDWYNAQNNINPQDPVLNEDGTLTK